MARTGFKRRLVDQPVAESPAPVTPVAPSPAPMPARRAVMMPANDRVFAIPKERPLQHEGYMRLVRLLSCAHCGIAGYSQFCHSDEGKGLGIKSDCRRGWPGCAPRVGIPGCHHLIGSTGIYTRDERRRIEADYAARTRAKIIDLGLWPRDLPIWNPLVFESRR